MGQRSCVLAVSAALLIGCGSAETTGGDAGPGPQTWLNVDPTWSSIYDGYFGPTGAASCTRGSGCHSAEDDPGTKASSFTCTSKDDCYLSLTGASHLVRPDDIANPGEAPFFKKIRRPGGTGRMPSGSSFVFEDGDVDVISTWIAAGAAND